MAFQRILGVSLDGRRPEYLAQLRAFEGQAFEGGEQAPVKRAHAQRQQAQRYQGPPFAALRQTGGNEGSTSGHAGDTAGGRGDKTQEIIHKSGTKKMLQGTIRQPGRGGCLLRRGRFGLLNFGSGQLGKRLQLLGHERVGVALDPSETQR